MVRITKSGKWVWESGGFHVNRETWQVCILDLYWNSGAIIKDVDIMLNQGVWVPNSLVHCWVYQSRALFNNGELTLIVIQWLVSQTREFGMLGPKLPGQKIKGFRSSKSSSFWTDKRNNGNANIFNEDLIVSFHVDPNIILEVYSIGTTGFLSIVYTLSERNRFLCSV